MVLSFSIQFYLIMYQKRTCSRTLSNVNYFRSRCLFSPWSWVISDLSIFFSPWSWVILFQIFFSIKFNSLHFNFILLYFEKEYAQELCQFWIISGLSVFLYNGLGLFYFLYLITLFLCNIINFNSVQINLIRLNSIKFHQIIFFKNNIFNTIVNLNYFRSKCLFPP